MQHVEFNVQARHKPTQQEQVEQVEQVEQEDERVPLEVDTEGLGLIEQYTLKRTLGASGDQSLDSRVDVHTDPARISQQRTDFYEQLLSGGALTEPKAPGMHVLDALS